MIQRIVNKLKVIEEFSDCVSRVKADSFVKLIVIELILV